MNTIKTRPVTNNLGNLMDGLRTGTVRTIYKTDGTPFTGIVRSISAEDASEKLAS